MFTVRSTVEHNWIVICEHGISAKFRVEDHARLDAKLKNENTIIKNVPEIDNWDVDRLAVWREMIVIMRERGMIV